MRNVRVEKKKLKFNKKNTTFDTTKYSMKTFSSKFKNFLKIENR